MENIDFELPTVNGTKLGLSRQLGKSPVLLIFFKHNCPTCQLTLPYLERLYSRYGGSKAAFWAIAQDDEQEASKFAEDYGINYNILLDKKPYRVSRKFDFSIVPNVILLDRDGREIFRFMGFQKDELEKLNYVLAGLDNGTEPLFSESDDVPAVKPG
jgi:peroxiredoxin